MLSDIAGSAMELARASRPPIGPSLRGGGTGMLTGSCSAGRAAEEPDTEGTIYLSTVLLLPDWAPRLRGFMCGLH